MICYEVSNGSITFDEEETRRFLCVRYTLLTVSICALFIESVHYVPLNAVSAKTRITLDIIFRS